ncbi:hypothetical protein N431DRAFT_561209 [Stipitochalara longipes BDJ]|nr:hypothetical protein N431DRAFT_561209 [Stipitochalara longipes BDJ]
MAGNRARDAGEWKGDWFERLLQGCQVSSVKCQGGKGQELAYAPPALHVDRSAFEVDCDISNMPSPNSINYRYADLPCDSKLVDIDIDLIEGVRESAAGTASGSWPGEVAEPLEKGRMLHMLHMLVLGTRQDDLAIESIEVSKYRSITTQHQNPVNPVHLCNISNTGKLSAVGISRLVSSLDSPKILHGTVFDLCQFSR